MDFQIPSNLSKQLEFLVEEKYLATFLGSGSVEVLSTPSMILFMVNVSRIMIDEILPDSHTTVGTQVCIKHLSACPKGSKVLAKSSVKEQNGKKIILQVHQMITLKV